MFGLGNLATSMFIVEEGLLAYGGKQLTKGNCIDPEALLYTYNREETAYAIEESIVWELERMKVQFIVMDLEQLVAKKE